MNDADRLRTSAAAAVRRRFLRHRVKFGGLFALVLVAAAATPHIVHGHFIVPQRFGQSAVILVDVLVFLVILYFYRKETRRLTAEKEAGERSLSDSYRYIGKANRAMDIVTQFMDVAMGPVNRRDEKETFGRLVAVLLVTVLKTEKGMLRFVEKESERTVAEYRFSLVGDPFAAKIPNKVLLGGKYFEAIAGGATIVTAEAPDVTCSLCFGSGGAIDADRKRLAATLLNQLLIVFLVYRSFRSPPRRKHPNAIVRSQSLHADPVTWAAEGTTCTVREGTR